MQKLLLFFFVVYAPTLWAQEQPITSQIKEVIVYQSQAQITRTAKQSILPGSQTLRFTHLSHSIDPSSIRVTAKGNFTLLNIAHRNNYLTDQDKPESIRQLEDSLNWYQDMLKVLKNKSYVLQKEEELLVSNQKISGAQATVTVAQIKAMNDYYIQQFTAIQSERMKIDEQSEHLNERIEKLKKQIQSEMGSWNRNTGEIIVQLSAAEKTTANFTLTYLVYQAGWSPKYDLRAEGVDQPIDLIYQANVYQSTGVSWDQVELSLSTGNPSVGAQKPELYPWYIDFYQPIHMYRKDASEAIKIRGSSSMSVPQEETMDEMESIADVTQVVEHSINVTFDIGIPYTIASGKQPIVIELQKHKLDASYRYAAAPKLDPRVYLQAQITGWEKLQLLPGQSSIFFEGTFVANGFIDPRQSEDTLNISLGQDPRIVISRKELLDYTSKKFIGNKVRETHSYEIAVRNTRTKAIRIVIEDQVPISQQNQIEIEITDAGGAKYEPNTGKLTWEIELNPQENKKLTFGIEVKYPKGTIISGI